MDIDTVDKKLYFREGNNISRANYDGSSVEVIVQNVDPRTVRVDWKGRRIFWIKNNEISMATLNGQERRVLKIKESNPYDLAVDSNSGWVLLTCTGYILSLSISLMVKYAAGCVQNLSSTSLVRPDSSRDATDCLRFRNLPRRLKLIKFIFLQFLQNYKLINLLLFRIKKWTNVLLTVASPARQVRGTYSYIRVLHN